MPPLSRDYFLDKGFQEIPFPNVGNCLFYDLGRNRVILIGSVATPNEMVSICQRNEENNRIIEDSVIIHNYDFDGYLTERKLNALFIFFS